MVLNAGLNIFLSILIFTMLSLGARLLFRRLWERDILTPENVKPALRISGTALMLAALVVAVRAIYSWSGTAVICAVIYFLFGIIALFGKPVRNPSQASRR